MLFPQVLPVDNTPRGALCFPAPNRTEAAAGIDLPIKSNQDIIHARRRGKELASQLGFSNADVTLIATAISELARNIVLYTRGGIIAVKTLRQEGRNGIIVVARDEGPGIASVALALQDGFSTSRGMGMGLPGVRRVMDWFELESDVNLGTVVTIQKWTTRRGNFEQRAAAAPPCSGNAARFSSLS